METRAVNVTLAQLRAIKDTVEKRLSRITQIVFPADSNQDYFIKYSKYLTLLKEQHPKIFGDMPERALPGLQDHFNSEKVIERKHVQQLYDDITEILTISTSLQQSKSDSHEERFQELNEEAKAVESFHDPALDVSAISLIHFQKWATSALNLLSDVFGPDSFYYIEFERYFAIAARSENNSITKSHYSQSLAIFNSAKEKFERGQEPATDSRRKGEGAQIKVMVTTQAPERPKPAQKPRLFIGSSAEGHDIAEKIQEGLEHSVESTIWSQGVFGLSAGNLESLVAATKNFDCAVLVLTPDDLKIKRDDTKNTPRDNVLFELGLFMGALGRSCTYIVYCRDEKLDLPTDLAGVTAATYAKRSDGNLRAALGPVCSKLKDAIRDALREK